MPRLGGGCFVGSRRKAAPTTESRQICLRIPLRPSRALRESISLPLLLVEDRNGLTTESSENTEIWK